MSRPLSPLRHALAATLQHLGGVLPPHLGYHPGCVYVCVFVCSRSGGFYALVFVLLVEGLENISFVWVVGGWQSWSRLHPHANAINNTPTQTNNTPI